MPPEVLFEDNHLLVVNKPAGMLTQPDNTGSASLLEECRAWLKHVHSKPGNVFLEAVHRLDKPASGIVLFAKTSKGLSRLNESMRAKHAHKVYLAVLSRKPDAATGTLKHYLVHGDHKAIVSTKADPQAKESILHYKIVNDAPPVAEIILETGRYHQIRAQFAAIGSPLRGDARYGGVDGVFVLHHTRLQINHPITREPITFECPAILE